MAETKTIALCIAGIDEEYNGDFLHSFARYAKEFHFHLLCFYSFSSIYTKTPHDYGERNIFHLINHELLDGLVVLGRDFADEDTIRQIVEAAQVKSIPVVSVDHHLDTCYNVDFDYDAALEKIITHIIDVHHAKRLNFIAGVKGNDYSERRVNIFRKVLAAHDIPVEEERIGYGDFWYGPANKVMDDFFASPLPFPDAIICANDAMAITAYERLVDAGYHVPEDVMLTGFDGINEALHHIPFITTAKHDIEKATQATFEVFDDIFNKKERPLDTLVDSKVILGGTCGCHATHQLDHNLFVRTMYNRIYEDSLFSEKHISMIAILTNTHSFQEVFEGIKPYAERFPNKGLWLCVNDTLLTEEEFSDILEDSVSRRTGYSSRMDLILNRQEGEWQGMMDFPTKALLPHLDEILQTYNSLLFFPLHVQEQTLGYVALSVDDDTFEIGKYYHFLMNISTALEITRSHQRQLTIIQNLENKYVHDPMTGLLNRRGFYKKVVGLFEERQRKQKLVSIASVDLNGLKPINDTYGHSDGDIAITIVGKALVHCSKRDAVCARFGGDEYVVAGAPETEEEAEEYINSVRAYLDDFNATSGKPYKISASFGLVTAIPNDSVTLDEFIRQADEKMYTEKATHHLSRGR